MDSRLAVKGDGSETRFAKLTRSSNDGGGDKRGKFTAFLPRSNSFVYDDLIRLESSE